MINESRRVIWVLTWVDGLTATMLSVDLIAAQSQEQASCMIGLKHGRIHLKLEKSFESIGRADWRHQNYILQTPKSPNYISGP